MSTTKTSTSKAITLDWKIGDVLKEYPSLLEVLVAQSPHFSRLKNPVLRRIHGRLVTVAQAASVAGIDPAALVRTLNAAVGQTPPEEAPIKLTSMKGTPEPPWIGSAPIAVRLDVREDQRNHSDPFSRIMAEVPKVHEGEVFYLKNTFEPIPLYDVLGKRGFVAWSREVGPQEWDIYFFKAGKAEPSAESASARPGADTTSQLDEIDSSAPTATVAIDVSELTPPQPMIKIMDALAALKSGEVLLVHHKRRPAYLYPKLAEMGYKQKTIEKGPDQIEIYIRKR